jgi:hypothetical protein
MATVSTWTKVGVAVQSAIGAAKTITTITKANPGVVTSTAHGFLDGEVVRILALGMSQVNEVYVRVDNKTDDTFELEGVDTTLFDTFTSGTAEKITYGTTLGIVRGFTGSGGEPEFADGSTIHDETRTEIPTIMSPGRYELDLLWDAADAGFQALRAASRARAKRGLRISFSSGKKVFFGGYVIASGLPTGTAFDIVVSRAAVTIAGDTTQYET